MAKIIGLSGEDDSLTMSWKWTFPISLLIPEIVPGVTVDDYKKKKKTGVKQDSAKQGCLKVPIYFIFITFCVPSDFTKFEIIIGWNQANLFI